MGRRFKLERCPVCTADTDNGSVRHCGSGACRWRRCGCGTVISDYGMWTAPRSAGETVPLDLWI